MDTAKIQKEFDEAIAHLNDSLGQIQTGRATTELLEEIMVTAYETQSPLQNVANIGVVDAKTLTVTPWDKNLVDVISKAISDANLGLGVSSEGDMIRATVPDMTEERRKEYVKLMKDRVEGTRQQVRAIRQKYMKEVEEMVKEGLLPEDDGKRVKDEIQKMVDGANEKAEELKEAKQNSLMEV